MRSPRPGFLLSIAAALLLSALVESPAQTFVQPALIPTGNWPAAIYTADVNGDGYADLIYIDQGATPNNASTTHVLLNDGKGNFKQSAVVATVGNSLAIGNISGGGHVDIGWMTATPFAPNSSYILNVAAGTGSGTFNPLQTVVETITGVPGAVQPVWNYTIAGQIQASGAMDLIAEDTANQVLWDFSFAALNGGLSHDNSSFPLRTNGGVGPLILADLNGDGLNDLVIHGPSTSTATVYLNRGGHIQNFYTFQLQLQSAGLHSLLVKDVNLDGRPDLVAETANGRIDFYLGLGLGTFQSTSSSGTGTADGTTGNGGHLITFANTKAGAAPYLITSTPAGVSTLFPSAGTSYYAVNAIYNAGPGHTSYATADFNGDRALDLAVDSPEGIAIIYGNADGSFQTSRGFAAGQPAMSGALGTFTSGNMDAIVSTAATQAQLLTGNGDGTFAYLGSPATAIPTTTQTGTAGLWSVVQAADLNGDGFVDIALTADGPNAALPASGSGLSVQLGSASGFAAPTALNAAAQFSYPASSSCSPPFNHYPAMFYGASAIGDYNWDGLTDIANRDSGTFRVMRGNNGTISGSSTQYPTLYWSGVDGAGTTVECHPHAHDLVISGDFNNDGHSDVIFQGFQGNSGSLIERITTGATLTIEGDLAVDGSLTTPGQMIAPAISSTFGGGVSATLGFPAFPGSAAVADLDRDGNNDLIVTYANLSANLQAPTAAAPNYIYIWYGSGGGKFLTSAKHPINPVRFIPSRNFYQVAVADMNLDGIPDLILSDGYIVSVQLGKGDGTFLAETHYLGGQGINSISVADVNHDGKPDLILANGGAVLTNPVANLEVLATNPDVNTGGITVLLNAAIPSGLISMGTVTASPEPTTYGEAFGLTATISSPLSGTAPSGTVAFSIDGSAIGSANVIGTSATIPVVPQNVYSTLAVGMHNLTAVYSGDGTFAQATYTGTHTVTVIPTTIGLALCVDPPGSTFPCGVNFPNVPPPLLSPVTMYFGQSIDGLATESESDLTGQIVFYNGASVFCTLNANLAQGGMTCPTASGFFPVGDSQVKVNYTGDSTHAASMSNSVQVIVSPDISTAVVTSSANPSSVGQSVTFTASVQGNFAVATGTVTFLDGSTLIGTGTLDSTGHATFTTATLALGKHSITVAYSGNTNFQAAQSPVLTQVVTAPVTGSVKASPEPSYAGNTFALTALIVPPVGSTTAPTGTVIFSIDGAVVGTGTVVSGAATFTAPATPAVGTHTLSAAYSGDTNYLAATFVGSHAVILSPSLTTLTATGPTTIYYGQPANSTYAVSGLTPMQPPTGSFTVQDNGVSVPYCTAIVLGSACPYADGGTNKLTVGTHALTILYLGDAYNAPSQSAPLVFNVLPDPTTATLTSSNNPAISGTNVTFTAKIVGNVVVPTGAVNFVDGGATLGTVALDANGNATFSSSTLAVGTHPITVVYAGTTNFNPATSAVLNQVITNGPTTFTLTVTPSPVRIEIGRDAVLQVTITQTGGFAEPVQLSCPTVPEEATCTFTQALIPAGGGITTLYFSPRAPRDCGSQTSYGGGFGGYSIATGALACLAMLPLYRRRRVRVILVSLVALFALAAMSGCGHCTDLGTRPGNYTFTVMGIAQGSVALTASQTIPVTVTTNP